MDTFDIYKKRKVILAFKFLSKKRIGLGTYESRELREFTLSASSDTKSIIDSISGAFDSNEFLSSDMIDIA